MRAGRFLTIAVVVALGLLLGGVAALPAWLDWNRHRDAIAALVAAGLGRPVRIEGQVALHLLPQPVLTASGVEVADVGDGVSMRARELRLGVALGPLLAGRVQARELVLRGPELRLPWPPAPGALAQRPSAWLTGRAQVEDGRLVVGGLTLTDIAATLSTDADTGTLSAAGTGSFADRAWRVTARLARPGWDGTAGLEWSLDGQGPLRDTGASFSGRIASDGALVGRVAGRGPDLSQLVPGPPVAWRAEGRLSAAGGLAVAGDLSVDLGGSPGRGAVALRVGEGARLDLSLSAGRLDLDAWLPVLLRPHRPGLPTGLDLSAEAASLAGGTLRRLRAAFDLGEDGVAVRDASASLPGEARLALDGRIPAGDKPGFEGAGGLVAPDLRATLHWLERFAPALLSAPPPGVLRTADARARVALAPGQLSLSDLRGRLDGEAVSGGLSVKLGARPAFAAGLVFERLALDAWLPDPADLPARLSAPGAAAELTRRFGGFDAELNLQAQRASWRGVPLERLALDARVEAARLTLRRLEATALGARLAASGTVAEGGRVTEAAAELSAPDSAPLRALVPAPWAGLLDGPGSARLALSGPPDALAAQLGVEVGDLRVEAWPTLDLPARRWAGPVTVRHPGAPRLLATLGLSGTGLARDERPAAAPSGDGRGRADGGDRVRSSADAVAPVPDDARPRGDERLRAVHPPAAAPVPRRPSDAPFRPDERRTVHVPSPMDASAWLGDGSFSLVARLAASPERVVLEGFDLVAGAARLGGRLVLERGEVGGRIAAETLPVPVPDPASAEPLPFWLLREGRAAVRVEAAQVLAGLRPVLRRAGADVVLRDGVLRAERFTAALDGGAATGGLVLDARADPPRVGLDAAVSDVAVGGPALGASLDLVAGTLDAGLDLAASGHSPAALLATLSGTVRVAARDGVVSGFDLSGAGAALRGTDQDKLAAELRDAVSGGTSPFARLEVPVELRRGVAAFGQARLDGPAGEALLSGTADLPDGTVDLRVVLRPRGAEEAPGLALRLTGPASDARRTPELAATLRWLATRTP